MDDMTNLILKKLDDLEKKIDEMTKNGCAKASSHVEISDNQREIFSRLRVVEQAQAEGKGKLAVFAVLVGALLTFALQWIGKHI